MFTSNDNLIDTDDIPVEVRGPQPQPREEASPKQTIFAGTGAPQRTHTLRFDSIRVAVAYISRALPNNSANNDLLLTLKPSHSICDRAGKCPRRCRQLFVAGTDTDTAYGAVKQIIVNRPTNLELHGDIDHPVVVRLNRKRYKLARYSLRAPRFTIRPF